jgi:hypothetical protein
MLEVECCLSQLWLKVEKMGDINESVGRGVRGSGVRCGGAESDNYSGMSNLRYSLLVARDRVSDSLAPRLLLQILIKS